MTNNTNDFSTKKIIIKEKNEIKPKQNIKIKVATSSTKLSKSEKQMINNIKKWNKPHDVNSCLKFNLNDNELIKLINVDKYFTNGYQYEYILKKVNLTIYKGEFVVIIGPSGSGKTTLLTILSALERPSKGDSFMFNENTICLNQAKLTKLRALHVGYIFQQYGLLNELSVEDNIKIAANLNKKANKKQFDVNMLLATVGLLKFAKHKASSLSGGQSQRVAICRALIKNPDVLYGDEPTGAIHINATKDIMNTFLNINKKFKTTIVIVTHNHAITELADRIIEIESGQIKNNYLNKNKKTVDQINWTL